MQPSSCARRRAFGEASGVWDIDLWEQHGVLSPLMQQQLRGWPSTTLFWCENCYENVTNWLDIGDHVRSKKHRHAMASAAESSKVLELAIEHASEPREDVNVARWASHLPHAETDKVRAASSEPLGGVNSICCTQVAHASTIAWTKPGNLQGGALKRRRDELEPGAGG